VCLNNRKLLYFDVNFVPDLQTVCEVYLEGILILVFAVLAELSFCICLFDVIVNNYYVRFFFSFSHS